MASLGCMYLNLSVQVVAEQLDPIWLTYNFGCDRAKLVQLVSCLNLCLFSRFLSDLKNIVYFMLIIVQSFDWTLCICTIDVLECMNFLFLSYRAGATKVVEIISMLLQTLIIHKNLWGRISKNGYTGWGWNLNFISFHHLTSMKGLQKHVFFSVWSCFCLLFSPWQFLW